VCKHCRLSYRAVLFEDPHIRTGLLCRGVLGEVPIRVYIHPSAWKVNPPKSVCRIVHSACRRGTKTPLESFKGRGVYTYLLWRRTKWRPAA
jgi:hypothetical protein